MDLDGCHCLICQDAPDSAWDVRDRRIGRVIREFGWNVIGVSGDARTGGWAYSVGLWHELRSPEVCVFGLPDKLAMKVIHTVAKQIKAGQKLTGDERRGDVLQNYDVAIKPVRSPWYSNFFGAGTAFYTAPPLPMMQILWPDQNGLLPWEPGVELNCQDSQPLLWMMPADHPPSAWAGADPYAAWPFAGSLPYEPARASADVIDGRAPVTAVLRRPDTGWWFLDAGGEGAATGRTGLRRILTAHPGVEAVADLAEGERADRTPQGWQRSTEATDRGPAAP